MSETKDPMIAALLREREGYVRFDKPDRVKAVDAELERRGYRAEPKKRVPREQKQATADDSSAKNRA